MNSLENDSCCLCARFCLKRSFCYALHYAACFPFKTDRVSRAFDVRVTAAVAAAAAVALRIRYRLRFYIRFRSHSPRRPAASPRWRHRRRRRRRRWRRVDASDRVWERVRAFSSVFDSRLNATENKTRVFLHFENK